MGFEKPQITPRRRIEVPEEARREARAGMGGEATHTATTPPAAVEPQAPQRAPKAAPGQAVATLVAAPAPEAAAPAPVKVVKRGRKPAPLSAASTEDGDVVLHTVQLPRSVVQQIKMTLLLATPGPDTPTTIKSYLEEAHRYYDAFLRKSGKLPPAK